MHQNFAFFPGELVFKHITVYPLEKEMAPTPVFLPGKIPWTEEPGGLQSVGSQSRT